MLEKFEEYVAREVERLQTLEAEGLFLRPYEGVRPAMREALQAADTAVIAEYKRASPSRGDINLGVEPEEAAQAYARAGAAALSVLTERERFKGDVAYLARIAEAVDIPLLRKDFIAHPVQVLETAGTPASAVLIIARFDPYAALDACMAEADKHGLEAVVEVFDERDLDAARELGAAVIQVNSRDLDTMDVVPDRHDRLIERKEPSEIWIAASGLDDGARIRNLKEEGYDAFLIGTSLMAGGDPGANLKKMLEESK